MICMHHSAPGIRATTTNIFSRSRMWRVLRNTKQMCADRVCAPLRLSKTKQHSI